MLEKEVKPIESMLIELKQLNDFYGDLSVLYDYVGEEYIDDFKDLRDATNLLRSEYSSLYSKIIVEHEELENKVR